MTWNSIALALAVLSSSAAAAEATSTTNGVQASLRLQGAARCAVSGCIVNPELHELHKLFWDGDARRRYREIDFEAERIDLISHPEIYDPGIMKKRFGVGRLGEEIRPRRAAQKGDGDGCGGEAGFGFHAHKHRRCRRELS